MIGAAIGGGLIFAIANGKDGFSASDSGFATNGWADRSPDGYNFGAMVVVEIVFTALLVFVVLSTTTVGFVPGFGALAIGLTLGMIHLATIPVDNTSVNPARSLGTALYAGWDHLAQLWVFIVFPPIGAVLGVLVWLLIHEERLEDTMFGTQPVLVAARDRAAAAAGKVEDRLG